LAADGTTKKPLEELVEEEEAFKAKFLNRLELERLDRRPLASALIEFRAKFLEEGEAAQGEADARAVAVVVVVVVVVLRRLRIPLVV